MYRTYTAVAGGVASSGFSDNSCYLFIYLCGTPRNTDEHHITLSNQPSYYKSNERKQNRIMRPSESAIINNCIDFVEAENFEDCGV